MTDRVLIVMGTGGQTVVVIASEARQSRNRLLHGCNPKRKEDKINWIATSLTLLAMTMAA
jgi:hypothetical protein